MLTKKDFQQAIVDSVATYPDVAPLYQAGDPRILQSFHFLTTYLQLLFPNGYAIEQMAQTKAGEYPNQLSPLSRADSTKFSTSRVRVAIDSSKTTWKNIDKMAPILSSIIPARLILYFAMLTTWRKTNYIGATSRQFVSN